MNKKALVVSTLAAALIVLASLSSVIGTNIVKSDAEKSTNSPLFSVRTQRSLDREEAKKISSNFLGKGKILNIFFLEKSSVEKLIDKALKIIDVRPEILRLVIDRIATMPEIVNLLKENGITINDFKNQMNQVIEDPVLLKERVDEAILVSPFGEDPLPLGLSTSNPLGCFIVALILAPIFVLIGAIIATITIITCFNIGGCFENIVQGMLDSFLQGLKPLDYS